MENNVKNFFTEEEWDILRKDNEELFSTVQYCPLHFDVTAEQKGAEDESINYSVTSTKL